jgi:hypothetical protein
MEIKCDKAEHGVRLSFVALQHRIPPLSFSLVSQLQSGWIRLQICMVHRTKECGELHDRQARNDAVRR